MVNVLVFVNCVAKVELKVMSTLKAAVRRERSSPLVTAVEPLICTPASGDPRAAPGTGRQP